MALLKGYLYIISDARMEFMEIGMTRDVYAKFHGLQANFPMSLKIQRYERCTYAKFREAKTRMTLQDLHIVGNWYRCDLDRANSAFDKSMSISDDDIRFVLDLLPSKADSNYPVQRVDTGEIFSNAGEAAFKVLGKRKLASKIRAAIKSGGKCGPTTWVRV